MNYEMVLSTGKKVVLREPKIADQDLAAQEVAPEAGDSTISFMLLLQTALLKSLIVSVDGKVLTGQEKESLDKIFGYVEYSELQLGAKEILGEVKKPKINMVKDCGSK